LRPAGPRRLDTRLLGSWCGSSLARFFRQAGLKDIVRKGWLVERWAPPSLATRQFVAMGLRYGAGLAAELDVPPADLEALQAAAADPARVLDDPDFCSREAFVVTIGRVPA
jgi:arsenite methyltransferase